jgi:hypothetical protein
VDAAQVPQNRDDGHLDDRQTQIWGLGKLRENRHVGRHEGGEGVAGVLRRRENQVTQGRVENGAVLVNQEGEVCLHLVVH